jgi:hypothetical protein
MESFDVALEPLRLFVSQVAIYLPRIAIALLILVAGWFIAKGVRFAVVRALRAVNFHVLTERAGVDTFLQQGGAKSDTVDIFGLLFFWLVLLGALMVAFNILGLAYVTDLLTRVVLFVPHLMVALLIIAFGAYFARFIGRTVASVSRGMGGQDAELLGRLAQYAVLIFVVLIALDQLNIGGDIVRQSFLIVLAGLVFALALAFGLGGKDWAASILERWWPKR